MRKMADAIRGSREWVATVLVAVLVTVLCRAFVFNVNVVQGTSMCTTLYNGDILVAQKFALGHIRRGDIVTTWNGDRDELLVKRVVGLPGESIHIDGEGYIYADGVLIPDEFQSPAVGLSFDYTDVILGEDEYFIMGDNRYNSYDSRYFGPIKAGDIRDVAVFRFFPPTVY